MARDFVSHYGVGDHIHTSPLVDVGVPIIFWHDALQEHRHLLNLFCRLVQYDFVVLICKLLVQVLANLRLLFQNLFRNLFVLLLRQRAQRSFLRSSVPPLKKHLGLFKRLNQLSVRVLPSLVCGAGMSTLLLAFFQSKNLLQFCFPLLSQVLLIWWQHAPSDVSGC